MATATGSFASAAEAASEADQQFAPLLGFDLSTAEGRAQAEQFLQGLAIGADDEFKKIILELLRAIRAIPDAVAEGERPPGEVEIVGRGAQGILETTANDLAALWRTGLILDRARNALLEAMLGVLGGIRPVFGPEGRPDVPTPVELVASPVAPVIVEPVVEPTSIDPQILATITDIRDMIAPLVRAPVVARVQPPAFSNALGAGAGVATVSPTLVIGNLTLPPVTITALPGDTPEATATRFSRRVIQELSQALAEEAVFTQRVGGRVVIRG